FIYALDKTRACLESAIAIEAQNTAAAAPSNTNYVHTINILTVPEGHSVAPNENGDLVSTPMPTIEHTPPQVDAHVEPEPEIEPTPAPPKLELVTPRYIPLPPRTQKAY